MTTWAMWTRLALLDSRRGDAWVLRGSALASKTYSVARGIRTGPPADVGAAVAHAAAEPSWAERDGASFVPPATSAAQSRELVPSLGQFS